MSACRNQGLFADRYLTGEERLLALPEWREAEGVEEAFEAIRAVHDEQAAGFTEATNEAQTEEDFIQPVLRELGWEYEVQEPIAGVNRVPDYALLTSAEAAEKLQKGKQARTLFKHESCQPFVEEGSHSTRHLQESLAWSEEAFEVFLRELAGRVHNLSDLLAVYGDYSDDYRGLTEALSRTDELIDQIAYALYGLTEEEIAIVEESVTR